MATRRTHNKSRLGCHQCKKRRIKCDNTHPTCANCDKKAITCSFLDLAPSSSLSIASSSASPPSYNSQPSSRSSIASRSTSPPSNFSQPSTLQALPSSTSLLGPAIAPAVRTPPHSGGVLDETYASPENIDTFVRWDLVPSFPQQLSPPSGEPLWDFLTYMNPSLLQPIQFPRSPIGFQPRLDDTWKNVRDELPPSLREVLTHYEYTTSLTLTTDDPAKAAWQSFIPELAHRHDFLTNCVLSVACLHLGRLHEDAVQKSRMNAIAAARMNKALKTYRQALENVTQDNAAALFASSTLTAVYLFRTSTLDIENLRASIPPHTLVPPADIVDKMLACVLRTIWGLRGPLTVLMRGWNWVVDGKMNPVAARKWWPKKRIPVTARGKAEDARLEKLEELWQESSDSEKSFGPQGMLLSQALMYLRESFGLVDQLTLPHAFPRMTAVPYAIDDDNIGVLMDRGAIFVWATVTTREFITLIEKKDRDALVLLAHYAILPGRVRNVWWLEGLGADFVISVAMALGRENWHLIAWPAQVLGVDFENAWGERKDNLEGLPDEMHMEVI